MARIVTSSALTLALCFLSGQSALAQECPIKVGVLHSLTGTMALSEAPLKSTMEMLIEKRNAEGGVLGCQLEAVIKDPGSDNENFAKMARALLEEDQVDVVFGNWTSASRKSVLPVFEELNGLLFYPKQFEGEESSRNIFYTAATPNQHIVPAADYFLDELEIDTFYLVGTDYVYPQLAHGVLRSYLTSKGVPEENIYSKLEPFSHQDWEATVKDAVRLSDEGGTVGIISAIAGDSNIGFYQELARQGVEAVDIPVIGFSFSENELQHLDVELLAGHLAAWTYFQSAETPENEAWVTAWKEFNGPDSVTYDPMEAHYIGFNMWANAVTQAGTADVDAVRAAMHGQEYPNLTGGKAVMQANHMLAKPALIGEIDVDGQFFIVSQTETIPGDAWSDHLEGSQNYKADWAKLECGKYDTAAESCMD